MDRIPNSPPSILPIPKEIQRPFFSVMIPVYNCSEFILDAITSVLKQDLGEELMQIEVIDDYSTDADIENMVMEIGKGRVKYFRQLQNVGSLRNFETCIKRATGKYVHILHGDDRVKQGFYQKMKYLFTKYPEAGAAFSRYSSIGEFGEFRFDSIFEENNEGILLDAMYQIAADHPVQYVSMVVRRDVYENLGSFYGVVYGEDWEMWVRIAKHYPIAYTPEHLAEYRRHLGAISWPKKENGQNAIDLAKTIAKIEIHLPDHKIGIMKKAKLWCAKMCISRSYIIWRQSQNKILINELLELAKSLKTGSPKIYYRIAKLKLKITVIRLNSNIARKWPRF